MANVSYIILKRRQKMHIRAYAVLCLLILAGMGFYSYQKWQTYKLSKEAVFKNKEFISVLREKGAEEKSIYYADKDGFNNLNKEIEERLAYIFPATDDYTALTRQLDSYEEELSKKNNPFEVSSIDYQTPTQGENFSVLSYRMNIKSSSENFTKFLHLMENSGSLTDQVRLMDISSIRLNFEGSEGENNGGPEIINFTVQINAYFQK